MKSMRHVRLKGGDFTATVDLSRGANCIRLRNEKYGASLLREPPEGGVLDNPYLYGMPILFPQNRIEGGCFRFEGRTYAFPINEPSTGCHLHGTLHETPFALVEASESHIQCRFHAEKGEYLNFPHAFEVLMEYALREDGFHHTVTVSNFSDENMPILLAFHTTFNTLFCDTSRPEDIRVFADISEEYERNLEKDFLPTGKKPPFDAGSRALAEGSFRPFEKGISRHYRGCGKMAITDVGKGLRTVYENDEKYTFRLIYNGGKEGYICLEPQNCLANCAGAPFSREEAGFDFLRAGESKVYKSKIFMEDFHL